MIRIGKDAFEVEPLSASNRCAPQTVSAHMLYENSAARYTAVDDRVVCVSGSHFEPYTTKLEGASTGAFQTIMLVGIQDRAVLAELDRFVEQMHEHLVRRVDDTMGERAGDFDILLRRYGWNAVSGLPMGPGTPSPLEVGLFLSRPRPRRNSRHR